MRTLGIVTAAVQLGFSLALWPLYGMHSGFDFVSRHSLARSWGLSFDVGVDGISLFLVILTALVTLLALLGANEEKNNAAFVRWVLLLSGATAGAFATRDLLVFFLFFELTLIPSYFLISQWGRAQARAAAMKFFVYTLFGSGFLLVGMIYLAVRHQHQVGGSLSFAYSALSHTVVSPAVATWVLVGFLIAFGVKSPLWPLHTWSPGAYSEAPTAGSMMLSALLAKLGTYGLLRFGVLILPAGVDRVRPYVMTLAVIGILYGSALAAVSKDLKRLVAYSSLAQVGFIILGLFSGSLTALNGAVLLMFNHGVITAAMFLLIGFVERRRGTSEIAALKGLQAPAPVLAGLFTLVMLGSIGLPGLNGFVSEFLILLGSFQSHPWWAAVATTGVIFAALYLLWAYQRVFHGEADEPNAAISDVTQSERLVLVPLCVLIVVAGVLPSLFLKPIGASVHHVAPATSQEAGR
jgi:NADH-quinone oxidoreductase subunit M